MAREYPEALAKTTLLGLFAPEGPAEIADPYDFGPAATRTVLEQIMRAVESFARLQPAAEKTPATVPMPRDAEADPAAAPESVALR
jgi:hypothetical protein